jgi:tripartite-type tricarboxylate transporter receptor subunit TctC
MRAKHLFAYAVLATAAIIGATAVARPALADAIADFYKKNDIRFVIGVAAGGSYDTSGRLLSRHIGKYIPGNPKVQVQNMPGASSRVAANYIYTLAPKDGTIIGAVSEAVPMSQALGEDGVRYDAPKLNWIGTADQPVSILGVWHTSGVHSIEDAMTKELVVGATSVSGSNYLYPALMKALIGVKFKIVVGYVGGNAINIALERGEVGARGSMVWSLTKKEKPDWIRDGKLIPIVQYTLKKAPDLPNVPRLIDLPGQGDAKAALEVIASTDGMGRPFVTTPDVPADRLNALRRGFDQAVKDPGFLSEAEKLGIEVDPTSGEEMQKIVATIVKAPPGAVAMIKAALENRVGVDCQQVSSGTYCGKE